MLWTSANKNIQMTLEAVGGLNLGLSDYKIAALTIRPLHFYTHDVYKVAIYPYMKMVFFLMETATKLKQKPECS